MRVQTGIPHISPSADRQCTEDSEAAVAGTINDPDYNTFCQGKLCYTFKTSTKQRHLIKYNKA
jgi:hypothetical protein